MDRIDKFGVPLKVGDAVVFCLPTRRYARLAKGKILGFTAKMVEVEYFDEFLQKSATTKLYCDRLAAAMA